MEFKLTAKQMREEVQHNFFLNLENNTDKNIIRKRYSFLVPWFLDLLDRTLQQVDKYNYPRPGAEMRNSIWAAHMEPMLKKAKEKEEDIRYRNTLEGIFTLVEIRAMWADIEKILLLAQKESSDVGDMVEELSGREQKPAHTTESRVVESDDPTGTNPTLSETWYNDFVERIWTEKNLSELSPNKAIEYVKEVYSKTSPYDIPLEIDAYGFSKALVEWLFRYHPNMLIRQEKPDITPFLEMRKDNGYRDFYIS